MAAHGRAPADSQDLLLVTTYVPVLTLCARATLLVLAVHWLVHGLASPPHVVAAAAAAAAYVDALAAAPAVGAVDAVSGFLAPVAFALVAQPARAACAPTPFSPEPALAAPALAAPAPEPPAFDAPPAARAAPAPAAAFRWIADFLWSFAATSDVAAGAAGLRVPAPPALKLFAAVAFALVHVALACAPLPALEMALRAVLFYTQCAVCTLCARFTLARDAERRAHAAHAHAALHLLFVHSYAALAGFLIVLGVHVRFILRAAPDDPEARPEPRGPPPPAHAAPARRPRPEAAARAPEREDYADLVRKLQAAKAASGLS
jgi:hypothetical protein